MARRHRLEEDPVVKFGRVVAVTVAAVIGVGLAPTPAAAVEFYQPPTPYDETYEDDPECEGLNLVVTGRIRGVDSIRVAPGTDGQAFFLKNRYRYQEVWTNTDTGETFRVVGRAVFREVSARFVPNDEVPAELIPPDVGLVGPVYEFTARERGRPIVVRDNGRVIAQDRGLAEYRQLFDTLGDSQPGGTPLDFEVVRTEGPHPFLLEEIDLCVLAGELTAPR